MRDKLGMRVSTQIGIIGFILVIVAGWIDTVGIKLFLSESPAFMTGRGLTLGYWAFKGDIKAFVGILIVILAFIGGASISTIITKKTGLTGGLVFAALLIIISASHTYFRDITIATIIIPMAMGGQNAATSLTPINRTTHLTGAATDIGINIANKNWPIVRFWAFRWLGFPLGAVIGFHFVNMVELNLIDDSLALFIPAFIIILTAIFQRLVFNIPLLDPKIINAKEREREKELKKGTI